MAIIICAALLTLAAALFVGSPRAKRLEPPSASSVPRRLFAGLAAAGGVAVIIVAGGALAQWAAFIVAGAELAGTAGWLLAHSVAERRALQGQNQVTRACDMLAVMLDAGELPAQALLVCSEDMPFLLPAAGAVQVGGDVAGELQRLSGGPGRGGLEWLARGWRLSETTGMPLSPVTSLVAEALRRQGDIAAQRRAELSTAKATSRLLAALPLVGIGMGFIVDANPLAFILGTMPGHLCLVGAATLICAGLIWTTHLSKESS